MSVEKIYHVFDKSSASHYVILRDGNGRKLHLKVPILHGPDPNKFIESQIAEFEEQERDINDHIKANFNPETLEKI